MSAPSSLVFYGLRFTLAPEELRQVLAATEQRLVQAGFEAPARLFAQYQPDL